MCIWWSHRIARSCKSSNNAVTRQEKCGGAKSVAVFLAPENILTLLGSKRGATVGKRQPLISAASFGGRAVADGSTINFLRPTAFPGHNSKGRRTSMTSPLLCLYLLSRGNWRLRKILAPRQNNMLLQTVLPFKSLQIHRRFRFPLP